MQESLQTACCLKTFSMSFTKTLINQQSIKIEINTPLIDITGSIMLLKSISDRIGPEKIPPGR